MRTAFLLIALAFAFGARAETCTVQTEIRDVIGPATTDLLKRVQGFAEREKCSSILLLVNTPGGSLDTTRTVVEMILNSPVPYLCLVSPSGGHAGSAGAIILQACHVNGALHGTNLGAATPVGLGQPLPKDLRQKILNDTRSWLEGMTKLRHRSERFGQDIILEAKAVTAEDALKLKAIDFVGDTAAEFLKFAQDRTVKLGANKDEQVKTGPIKEFPLDTRYTVVSLLTDPEFAYMLLLGSLALLYFEFTHPGVIAPGIAGAVGLVVSMIALNKLDVEWAGLILIFLGVGLLVAELFLPTFGVVGAGGLVSLVLGSIFLFDPVKTGGYRLPVMIIFPVVLTFGLFFAIVSVLVYRTRRVRKKGGFEDLIGVEARVVKLENDTQHRGFIELRGETWKFESPEILNLNDTVMVKGYRGLVLDVSRKPDRSGT
jgi:membrane-bound serine protease (ClpP class)